MTFVELQTIEDFKTFEGIQTFNDPEILETFEPLRPLKTSRPLKNLELIEAFATSRCFRHNFLTFLSQLVCDTPTPRDAIASKKICDHDLYYEFLM